MVALFVAEPAVVCLTVHDHVQLDRLTGTSAERHGDLLSPGTTPVRLAAGTYVFRTTAGAQVQVSEGAAIEVTAVRAPADKGDWPDLAAAHTPLRRRCQAGPPSASTAGPSPAAAVTRRNSRGRLETRWS